jgi:hypothetical protein
LHWEEDGGCINIHHISEQQQLSGEWLRKHFSYYAAEAVTYCYHCQVDLHTLSPLEFGSDLLSSLTHIGTWSKKKKSFFSELVSYSCQCVLACHAGILGLGVKRMGAPESVEGYVKSPLFGSFLQNPGGGGGGGRGVKLVNPILYGQKKFNIYFLNFLKKLKNCVFLNKIEKNLSISSKICILLPMCPIMI